MTRHVMKSWTQFYQAIKAGRKLHDLRSKKDRHFQIGDICTLQEYLSFEGRYTGEELDVEITYITSNDTPCAYSSAALDRDHCILSLKLIENSVRHFDPSNPDRRQPALVETKKGRLRVITPREGAVLRKNLEVAEVHARSAALRLAKARGKSDKVKE